MRTKEQIEIWLLLADPVEARRYIEEFDWCMPPELCPDKVCLDSGRIIYFTNMNDEDCVIAAMEILRSIEVPRIMREKSYELHEH